MAIPKDLFRGFDDDDWEDLLESVTLATALVDQLSDHMKLRRKHVPLENWDVNPVDPHDAFVKDMQNEVLALREDNQKLTTAVRSLDAALQLMLAKIKRLLEKDDKGKPDSRRPKEG